MSTAAKTPPVLAGMLVGHVLRQDFALEQGALDVVLAEVLFIHAVTAPAGNPHSPGRPADGQPELFGPESIRQVADRLSGARKAMKSVPDATLEVFATDSLTVLSGRSAGEAIRFRPPAERPDAIFAANDLLAVGVLQGLMLMGGVQVPREIALIGYDDIDFAAAAVVPLSSIRQPSAMIGSTALELLLREAAPDPGFVPQQIVFPPELVVRASTLS